MPPLDTNCRVSIPSNDAWTFQDPWNALHIWHGFWELFQPLLPSLAQSSRNHRNSCLWDTAGPVPERLLLLCPSPSGYIEAPACQVFWDDVLLAQTLTPPTEPSRQAPIWRSSKVGQPHLKPHKFEDADKLHIVPERRPCHHLCLDDVWPLAFGKLSWVRTHILHPPSAGELCLSPLTPEKPFSNSQRRIADFSDRKGAMQGRKAPNEVAAWSAASKTAAGDQSSLTSLEQNNCTDPVSHWVWEHAVLMDFVDGMPNGLTH